MEKYYSYRPESTDNVPTAFESGKLIPWEQMGSIRPIKNQSKPLTRWSLLGYEVLNVLYDKEYPWMWRHQVSLTHWWQSTITNSYTSKKCSSYHIFIGCVVILSCHLRSLIFMSTCHSSKMERFFPRRDELLCLAILLLYIRRRQCDVTPAYTC